VAIDCREDGLFQQALAFRLGNIMDDESIEHIEELVLREHSPPSQDSIGRRCLVSGHIPQSGGAFFD